MKSSFTHGSRPVHASLVVCLIVWAAMAGPAGAQIVPDPSMEVKWEQGPVFNPESQYPDCFWGWDEISIYGSQRIVADDWRCQDKRPVTDIHWWGSYRGWDGVEPIEVLPKGFHLAIWTDVPAGAVNPWSHPGHVLWEMHVPLEMIQANPIGCDFHPVHGADIAFRYDFYIPESHWFYQDGEDGIYWISIAAVYEDLTTVRYPWGWLTREHFYNDDAVRIHFPSAPVAGSVFEQGQPIELPDGVSWDMAFILTTKPIATATPTASPTRRDTPTHTSTNTPRPTDTEIPTETPGEFPRADLGDAPDSSNSFGVSMTAYTAVAARFPTVFGPGSPAFGPKHWNPRNAAYLGPLVTLENEADTGPDQDPSNNIVPPFNGPNRDLADDGLVLPLVLPYCSLATVEFDVTFVIPGEYYVNIWFDWNRDGDWNDITSCPVATVPEWSVRNMLVASGVPGMFRFTSTPFVSNPPVNGENFWMRITLSGVPIPLPSGWNGEGGDGPPNGYEIGETEDYLINEWVVPEPTDTPVPTRTHTPTNTDRPTETPKPTETAVQEVRADLGDAPDSSNSTGGLMTAYPIYGPPGVIARYPTVFSAGSPAFGPKHWRPLDAVYLGNKVTLENEADAGPDQDVVNNLDSAADRPDQDGADDGLILPLELPHCDLAKIQYIVTFVTPGDYYVNVWFDWNRDGDWQDILNCPNGALREWAVVNQPVSSAVAGQFVITSPPFRPWHSADVPRPFWMRITVSEVPRPAGGWVEPGGDGPPNGYLFGETEDYYVEEWIIPEPTDTPSPRPTDTRIPTETPGEKPRADLGDAPDSTYSFAGGAPMTAYPKGGPLGIAARYPTVFGPGSPAFGPLHLRPRDGAFLGDWVTLEDEAIPPALDEDPLNNLLPVTDAPDLDRADDGVAFPLVLPHCQPSRFPYVVTFVTPGQYYVNIWCDWNRDGDWEDILDCPGGVTREWIVQNQLVSSLSIGQRTFLTPPFRPWHSPNLPRPFWMRITLSDGPRPAAGWYTTGGDGPPNGFKYGETEDYYVDEYIIEPPTPTGEPTDTPVPPTPTETPGPDTPTATPKPEAVADLGDAPDSSNSFGSPMTAYPAGGPPGVFARYPSVYAAGSPPFGPIHWRPRDFAYLGPRVSLEYDADLGPDQDFTPNLRPPIDRPDRDRWDDGVRFPLVLPDCGPTRLTFRVRFVTPGLYHVNIWFDWNRDGDWNDTVTCLGTVVPEWAVQNMTVSSGFPGLVWFTTPVFGSATGGQTDPIWMRITLSRINRPVGNWTGAGGDGPVNGYYIGETEDYYVRKWLKQAGPIDTDGDGVPDLFEKGNNPGPGTSLYLSDSDGDCLPDGYEDRDRNGEVDFDETDPRDRDTDGDRYHDGVEELVMLSDPLDPDDPDAAYPDRDGDGLPAPWDPDDHDPDYDGDRRLDGFESPCMASEKDPNLYPWLGDVDENTQVDNGDAQRILNFFGNRDTPGTNPDHGDLNNDSVVDNGDSQNALNFFGNRLMHLPAW